MSGHALDGGLGVEHDGLHLLVLVVGDLEQAALDLALLEGLLFFGLLLRLVQNHDRPGLVSLDLVSESLPVLRILRAAAWCVRLRGAARACCGEALQAAGRARCAA